jgi:hypothetical protein
MEHGDKLYIQGATVPLGEQPDQTDPNALADGFAQGMNDGP